MYTHKPKDFLFNTRLSPGNVTHLYSRRMLHAYANACKCIGVEDSVWHLQGSMHEIMCAYIYIHDSVKFYFISFLFNEAVKSGETSENTGVLII